jgi:hypothetical protein
VVTGRCTGHGHGLTSASGQFNLVSAPRVDDRTLVWPDQRVRSVHRCTKAQRATGASGQASRGAESSDVMIGREARPVMYDRTCPVVEGAYWTQTGRWHCRIRSFARVCPVVASRARGAERSARPVS